MSKAETTGQTAYSAKPPVACLGIATTRRPCHASAPGPQAATTPITSMPGVTGSAGLTIMFLPLTRSMSFRLSGIAWTRTRSSPVAGTGTATRSSCIASTGSGPNSCTRHARMDSGLGRDPEAREASLMPEDLSVRFGFEPEALHVGAEGFPDRARIDAERLGRIAMDSVLVLRVVGDEGLHPSRGLVAERQAEGAIDPLHRAELVGDEILEVHVVELGGGRAIRRARGDRMLEDALDARGPVASDLDRIDLAAPHRAHQSRQARVGGHRLHRIAVGEDDARIGIAREQVLEPPHVRTGLEHPAVALHAPLQMLELRLVERVDERPVRLAIHPVLIGRHPELVVEEGRHHR